MTENCEIHAFGKYDDSLNSSALTLKELRNSEINSANELFYELLDDYLALNQQYLSKKLNDSEKKEILSQIGATNKKLNDLAHGISTNNEQAQNDIDRTFREHESEMNSLIFGSADELKRNKEFLKSQIALRETLHKLSAQLRAENSRYTIKYWISIVALIFFAILFGVFYRQMS